MMKSSSSNSKGSHDRQSIKSQSSNGTRKKRSIDGVHDSANKEENLPSAYAFQRSNSKTSTNSTVTPGNNTSLETHHLSDESRHKRERAPSRRSSTNQLPPLSHPSSNIFDEDRFHRRSNSGTTTASSLSVIGFSLSLFERPKCKYFTFCSMHYHSIKRVIHHQTFLMRIDFIAGLTLGRQPRPV
jgi:hypothetical protein